MFNLLPGQGLGLNTEKEIAFGLGTPFGEVYVETIVEEEGGGGSIVKRRKTYREYIVDKEHEGKWKKRLDKEDKEMLELIVMMAKTLE
ncbi:MAG: hypothetical protein BBJ57_07220 [Desulfobacterales bacterium PC51MH44]|nr:MAG: hypothetical protein BBJ57_07220 [Desulfobacterales bacterium PC51MH44]